MDVFRTLLCAGLALLLWNVRFRGIRPVRDFVLWGVNYPFHFTLMSLLILVVWGWVGVDFGLQGLFLENNAPTQILVGAAVMLLFAALILHYSVLDSPGRWWSHSLTTLVGVLRDLNVLMPRDYPVQRVLRNGFLERFDRHQIEALDDLVHRVRLEGSSDGDALGTELVGMLGDEPFRLLVSPAILLIKGFMLVLLVGVVPTLVVPLFNRDPRLLLERLPWLVGVVAGDVLGIVLACITTRWAALSAGWEPLQTRLLDAIRGLTEAAEGAEGGPAAGGAERRLPVGSRAGSASPIPPWYFFLVAFFAIHFAINVALPEGLTTRWIDWPERTWIDVPGDITAPQHQPDRWSGIPWLPAGVLLAEALGAAVLVASPRLLPKGGGREALVATIGRVRHASRASVRFALEVFSRRLGRWTIAASLVVLAAAAVVGAMLGSAPLARSLREGLRGVAFLGTFLALWLVAFRLAARGAPSARDLGRLPLLGRVATLFLSVLFYLAGVADPLIILLSMSTLFWLLPSTTGSVLRASSGRMDHRAVSRFAVVMAAAVTLAATWGGKGSAPAAALWLGLALIVLGASALAGVARRRPALLYPLTLLLAYTAFAIPYNTLDERWQSGMPAAGSIACMVGLVAAVYTVIAFLRPKGSLMASAVVVAAVIVLNGNAWFVDPNEFKATFPRMEAYYALPVYLDSRDYFRDTTPSTVRLRDRRLTGDLDRLEKQGASERLATAYFRMLGQSPAAGGGHALRLRVEDPRGRLRAGLGDEMRLASEEWFTTQLEGRDCVVLAEEPFFRKIYRWFRYEMVQMVRDGIIRGPAYPLRSAQGKDTERTTASILYEPVAGPGDRLGLRLRGLAPAYTQAEAQYVLITMYWSGRVVAVEHRSHLDTYDVDFIIPPGHQPLDSSQLKIMGTWLERCHLDAIRPAESVDAKLVEDRSSRGLRGLPRSLPGDCLVLEDARAEAPVPVGIYLAGAAQDAARSPGFDAYWPTHANLARHIEGTPAPVELGQGPLPHGLGATFTLRPAHDRGIFASPDHGVAAASAGVETGDRRPVRIALYNARRVRPGDRLVLSWNGQGHTPERGEVRRGAIFEVRETGAADGPRDATEPLPPGYRWATLLPVAGSGAPAPELRGLGWDERPVPLVGEWQVLQPLNNTEVLLAWKGLVGGLWSGSKPKLVIVTVSGGGIRASVWTSVVLRKLERTLGAEFPYHIRLITGASGGMVGGSYYVTSLAPPPPRVLRGGQADFSALHGISSGQFVDQMATDQLDAVAGRMVFADLISPFNPFLQKGDRGRTLEQTWVRWTGGEGRSPLGRPLQSYAADERLGWRPSMVYTPMMVEDGRRLLVSNLDLAFATRNVGGLLIEPSSRKIDRPAIQGQDLDRSIHDEDDVFSLSAVEFFRLFPEAHDFRVTTAVRMSASFPWVSPAISLPTLPPRRVVDAGYYDNYGVNLAALWLAKMRSWLEANTSGVVVVQIRDHVSQGARTEIDFDRLSGGSALDRLTWHADRELITPGLQAISTPLLGMSNARQWTMSFRNDEQVDLLDLLFDDEKSRDFFRTVVFECPVEVSLNWQLSAREQEILSSGFGRGDADPREELARTKDYLIGRDSYEFHKWKVAHRNDRSFQADLKAKFDEQLGALGIRNTERLSLRQSQQLYENIVMNLKRLELLRDWWQVGHEQTP